MQTMETGMGLFVEHALAAYEAGGAKAEQTTQVVCMAKWICAEQLQQGVANGMRVMGGRAYFGELDDMEPHSVCTPAEPLKYKRRSSPAPWDCIDKIGSLTP
jgi:alkylation response protein AidB-like acyl-CoA dehydrogenase